MYFLLLPLVMCSASAKNGYLTPKPVMASVMSSTGVEGNCIFAETFSNPLM